MQESGSTPGYDFPSGTPDERELFLHWLHFLRGAIVRKVEGLSDEDARWRPDSGLISLLGIVNHLTHVEWRWLTAGCAARRSAGARRTSAQGVSPSRAEDGTRRHNRRRSSG